MTTAQLPAVYRWLTSLAPLPRMVEEALNLYGTLETPGARDNPTIMAWARETGLQRVYTADSVPWCGLFIAVVAKRAGKTPVSSPLWALSWSKFGVAGGQPRLGDVLTFKRDGGGHVGIYIGGEKLPKGHRIVAADVGDFATANGFYGLGNDQRGAKMTAALRKGRFARGKADPEPLAQFRA